MTHRPNLHSLPIFFRLLIIFTLSLIILVQRGPVRAGDPPAAPPGLAREPGPPPIQALGNGDQEAWEWQVIRLVNQERAKPENGSLPPLKHNTDLLSTARAHSQDMADDNYFAHDSYNYNGNSWTYHQSWSNRIHNYYSGAAIAENIAAGYGSPADVMDAWMNSTTGHRENILSSSHREIGAGYYYDSGDSANIYIPGGTPEHGNGPYYDYWVQDFGSRSGVYPIVINNEAYSTTNCTVQLYIYNPGGGQQMRFSNNGSSWSDWESFNENKEWNLTECSSGTRTVYAQVETSTQTFSADDSIQLVYSGPILSANPTETTFLTKQSSGVCHPSTNHINISNTGGGTLTWSSSESSTWFQRVDGPNSIALTCVASIVDDYGLGEQSDTLVVTAIDAQNSPQNIPVNLIVVEEIYTVYMPIIAR